jgi:hypothetical protein
MAVCREKTNDSGTRSAWQSFTDDGADMNQLEYLLTLSPIERLRRHDRALTLVRTPVSSIMDSTLDLQP